MENRTGDSVCAAALRESPIDFFAQLTIHIERGLVERAIWRRLWFIEWRKPSDSASPPDLYILPRLEGPNKLEQSPVREFAAGSRTSFHIRRGEIETGGVTTKQSPTESNVG
jgi:hypothetical protein